MHWIQTLRERLQIDRLQMAIYLRLSMHSIKAVELQRRPLPDHAAPPALALLQASYAQAAASTNTADTTTLAAALQQWREQRAQAQQALATAQSNCAAAQQQAAIFTALAATLANTTDEASRKRFLWAEGHKKAAEGRIKNYGTTPQTLLQARIEGLTAQIDWLEKQVES